MPLHLLQNCQTTLSTPTTSTNWNEKILITNPKLKINHFLSLFSVGKLFSPKKGKLIGKRIENWKSAKLGEVWLKRDGKLRSERKFSIPFQRNVILQRFVEFRSENLRRWSWGQNSLTLVPIEFKFWKITLTASCFPGVGESLRPLKNHRFCVNFEKKVSVNSIEKNLI